MKKHIRFKKKKAFSMYKEAIILGNCVFTNLTVIITYVYIYQVIT